MLSDARITEEPTVGMEVTGLDDRFTKITLSGRLDTPGVGQIETRFLAAAIQGGKSAVIDLSQVSFVASMGIRMFINAARTLRYRQAKLALYGAPAMVNDVFEHTALRDIIPIVATEEEAITAVES